MRQDGQCSGTADEQGLPIRGRLGCDFGADQTASPGTVINDQLLAEQP
jgi:hypothetical protein